jgi:hypothetical protein
MAAPQIPIDVDPATGVWTTDALPMIYVPRHYFVNLQTAMAQVLGDEAYHARMYEEGRKAAFEWCAGVSKASGMRGLDVFHHYMRRLSQRGWGLFHPEHVDLAEGSARIRLENSIMALHLGQTGRRQCVMYAGWGPGALAWAAHDMGTPLTLTGEETQCASQGHAHCMFEVRKA